jgi:hypothetical protein
VHCWSASTEVVVIHCREIVMDERVNVYQLDGAGSALHFFLSSSNRPGSSEDQRGTNPFPTAENAVAHGFMEP